MFYHFLWRELFKQWVFTDVVHHPLMNILYISDCVDTTLEQAHATVIDEEHRKRTVILLLIVGGAHSLCRLLRVTT